MTNRWNLKKCVRNRWNLKKCVRNRINFEVPEIDVFPHFRLFLTHFLRFQRFLIHFLRFLRFDTHFLRFLYFVIMRVLMGILKMKCPLCVFLWRSQLSFLVNIAEQAPHPNNIVPWIVVICLTSDLVMLNVCPHTLHDSMVD